MRYPVISSSLGLFAAAAAFTLPAVMTAQSDESEEIFTLSPFEVSAQPGTYHATNSISATRINMEIKDIPMNLSVVTRDLIEDTASFNLQDSLEFTGGVSRNNASTFYGDTAVNIRGINNTPIFRNGIRTWDSVTDSANIERIEVVKGPASVLYGNAAPGGLVNYITKRPQSEREGSVRLVVGSWENYRAELDLTGPMAGDPDGPLYRLVAAATDRKSFRRFEEFENLYIAPTFLFPLGEDTSVQANFEYDEMNMVTPRIVSGTLAFGFFDPVPGNQSTVFMDLAENFNLGGNNSTSDRYRATAQVFLDHDFGSGLSGRLTVNYDQAETKGFNINKHFPTNRGGHPGEALVGGRFNENDLENTYLRADMVWNPQAGESAHQVLFGAEYRDSEEDFIERLAPGSTDFYIDVYDFNNLPDSAFDISNNLNDYNAPNVNTTNQTKVKALYLSDQITLMDDRLNVLVGVRYDDLEIDGLNRIASSTQSNSSSETSPMAGVLFKVTENISPFVSYTTSFEPLQGIDSDGNPLRPQDGEGIEGGVKFSAASGRISGTLSYFEITRSNTFINAFDITTGTSANIQEGEEETTGFDLELFFNPVENWQIMASWVNANAIISRGSTFPGGVTNTGRRLKNAPENKITLWTKYRIAEGPLEGFQFGGGYIYEGERVGIPFPNQPTNVWAFWPDYDRFDLFFGYDFGSEENSVELRLNVQNVTDERYVEGEGYYGEPRSLTGSLSFKF